MPIRCRNRNILLTTLYPPSGKTTLIHAVAERTPRSRALFFDDALADADSPVDPSNTQKRRLPCTGAPCRPQPIRHDVRTNAKSRRRSRGDIEAMAHSARLRIVDIFGLPQAFGTHRAWSSIVISTERCQGE